VSSLDLCLVLVSAVLHAVWNVFAKRSAHPLAFLGLLSIAWVLLLLPGLLCVPMPAITADYLWIVAASAVSHVFYQVWLARAYQTADLTVVYPISRSTPAFVALVAVPWMGDAVTGLGAVGIGTVVIGIWLVQAGGQLRWRALLAPGARFAYLTLAATVVYSLVDKLGIQWLDARPIEGGQPALTFFASMATATGALLVPYALWRVPREAWRETATTNTRDLAVSAVFGIASYLLILEAMRRAPVSYVTCVRQTSVLVAALLGMRMLGERPGRARLWGSAMVVIGVVFIALE